ncbi:MAG: hypothetical protein HQM08_07375 [Candidatus Riflebacteria bacterium]|nr:hypothetical protein [Candidatus Riflebacteria bacterium]
MKPKLFLFIALLLMLQVPSAVHTQTKYGFVDYRMLLLAHPVMQRFDPETRRFADSPSAFVLNKDATRASLEQKLKKLTNQMKDLDEEIKPFLKNNKKVTKKYEKYWSKRKALQEEFDLTKLSLSQLKIDGNYNEGRTSISSLVPVIELLNSSITEALNALKKKYELSAILDISSFVKPQSNTDELTLINSEVPSYENLQRKIWNSEKITRNQLADWMKKIDPTIVRYAPDYPFLPIRAGAVDLVIEATNLIRSKTKPTFKGEEDENEGDRNE